MTSTRSSRGRAVFVVGALLLTPLAAPLPASAHSVGESGASGTANESGRSRPAACGRPGSELVLTEDEMQDGRTFRRQECDLAGVTVRHAEAAALVPERGYGVAAFATSTDGHSALSVMTADDGSVTVAGEAGAVGEMTTPAGPFNCGGAAYATYSGNAHRHNHRNFYINGASYPHSITKQQWIDDIKFGAGTWRYGRNRCGLPENTPAGLDIFVTSDTSLKFANISDSGGCLSRDDYSLVSGGDLPGSDATGGTYAVACIWWQGSAPYDIIEGDVKIDGYDFSWIPAGQACNNRLHLPSGVAHEFGHWVGLRHVSETDYGSLVMSPNLSRCEFNHYLGEGDYRGRDYLY